MAKFGDLIDIQNPVLLIFFTDWNESSKLMHDVLTNVATAIGDKGKVLKINVDKNEDLASSLRVSRVPTLMIYKEGKMVWRENGKQGAKTLIALMNQYV